MQKKRQLLGVMSDAHVSPRDALVRSSDTSYVGFQLVWPRPTSTVTLMFCASM